ncbi:MAG: hypothetical protein WCG80_02550 [Spirochaetales bacterium]
MQYDEVDIGPDWKAGDVLTLLIIGINALSDDLEMLPLNDLSPLKFALLQEVAGWLLTSMKDSARNSLLREIEAMPKDGVPPTVVLQWSKTLD